MKTLTLLANGLLGATLLTVGCGQDQGAASFSPASATAVSTKDSPLSINLNQTTQDRGNDDAGDSLHGYYLNCRNHPQNTDGSNPTWQIWFGTANTQDDIKIVEGDVGCQLFATGLYRMVPGADPDNDPPVREHYNFVDPSEITTSKEIQIRPQYNSANVVMALRDDGSNATTKGALVNVLGVDNISNATTLSFRTEGFKIEMRSSATAAGLLNLDRNVTKIGFSSIQATTVSEWKAPTFQFSNGTDAAIKLDIDKTILTAAGSFKLDKTGSGQSAIPATDVTYGNPGAKLTDKDGLELIAGSTGAVTGQAYYNSLDEAARFQSLHTAYGNLIAQHPASPVSATSASVVVAASDLYPVTTDLTDANALTTLRKNLIILRRRDLSSGVVSYTAFTTKLTNVD